MATESIGNIGELFFRPITRSINSVVKVDQDDAELVQQELDEYVLTGSLEQHYSHIFDAILDTEFNPTDETSIWISGFFGSGKSHFMKILGYVLENRDLADGRSAAEAFEARLQDEMLKGSVGKLDETFECEVLMFQIGSRASRAGEDSITDVINRQFNRERGYAQIPWVARLEEDLEREGKYDAFVDAIESERDKPWTTVREGAIFVEQAIREALVEINSGWDESDAKSAIQNVKDEPEIAPASLAERLLEHVEALEAETDKQVRYFVFLDEISQFIGDDEQMLLELQSIAEQFGQQGNGKLWLGVTSQEKIQELVPGVLAKSLEESKVADRFPLRFDLISDNLDHVVRERILKKKSDAIPPLRDLYQENEGRLSARYKLNTSRQIDTIDEESFIECYPFLPYQLEILPRIFAALRGRGSDDRLTGRERTLIDVTQQVFNEPQNLREQELGSLATLDLIYEEIVEEIDDDDQRTIREVDPKGVDTEVASRVLKSLYLLQRLDWISNTPANIATTLYDDIGDKSDLDEQVEAALEQLVDEGYVGLNEDGYRFLQESERKLEEEIESEKADVGDVRREAKKFIREILDDADTVRYEGQAFDITVTADGDELSSDGHIQLEAYSPLYYDDVDPGDLKTQSFGEESTIYWIANADDADSIYGDVKRVYQVREVLNRKQGERLSEEEQRAVDRKKDEFDRMQSDVESALTKAFQTGTLIHHGDDTALRESGTKIDRIIQGPARDAVEQVFPKLDAGLATVSNQNIEQIFGDLEGRSNPTVFENLGVVDGGELNTGARICSEVIDEIEDRKRTGEVPTGQALIDHFGEPPYGWSRDVVRLAAAALFRNGSIVPTYKERVYETYTDDGAEEVFTQVSKFRQASFEERETVDIETRNEANKQLDILFDKKVKQTDQEVASGIKEVAGHWIEICGGLVPQLERCDFPLTDELEQLSELLNRIRDKPTSAARITAFVDNVEELRPLVDAAKSVHAFDDEGKLDEYQIIRDFMVDEWQEFSGLAASSRYVEMDETVPDAAARVLEELDSESVVERWTDVRTDYQTVAGAYASTYEDLYETRHDVYDEAVGKVRDYAASLDEGDSIDSDALEGALHPLTSRMGESSIDVEVDGRSHLGLNPSLTRLNEHLQTVDSYQRQAREAVEELIPEGDDVETRRVSLTEFFGTVTVRDLDDLEGPIASLKERVADILDGDEDAEIEIRFD